MVDVNWEPGGTETVDEAVESICGWAVLPYHLLADARVDGDLPGSGCTNQKLILIRSQHVHDLAWKLCRIAYLSEENVGVEE